MDEYRLQRSQKSFFRTVVVVAGFAFDAAAAAPVVVVVAAEVVYCQLLFRTALCVYCRVAADLEVLAAAVDWVAFAVAVDVAVAVKDSYWKRGSERLSLIFEVQLGHLAA